MALTLNYHHLYYFFAVAKSGSISKAANELALTPPTLSSQLKEFQRAVKTKLFERDGNALKLTPEGRVFFKYARQMFALGDQLEDRIRDHAMGDHPAIQIGVPHGLPASYITALVNHILKRNDKARIELEEGALDRLTPKMGDQRLDLVLTTEKVRKLEGVFCENTLVGELPIVFATRAVRGNHNYQFINTRKMRFIVPTSPAPTSNAIENFLNSFEKKEVCEVPDRDVALSLALKGQGTAVVDSFSFHTFPPRRSLRLVRIDRHAPILESVFLANAPRKMGNPIAEHALSSFRIPAPAIR